MEHGLKHEQLFVKKEATAEDILLILSTLWKRGSSIRITPRTRASFHSAVLIAAVGGFRMGVVTELTYRQVQFAIIRVQGTPQLIATLTLKQNKRQENTIRSSQDEL